MVSPAHVAALTEARRRVPRHVWQQLATRLAACTTQLDPAALRHFTEELLNRDAAWLLFDSLGKHEQATGGELAAAMVAVDFLVGDDLPAAEIIWTGPANGRFPVRRIDQVLYDLIATANHRIVLVTFAAHRVRHLCAHLTEAVNRGVELTLIVESEEESEGQLTHDAVAAFQNVPLARSRLYYWPVTQRNRNAAGRPGKLHVKCAIVDDVAIIGSANLTDDAFTRNMELGMLVRDDGTVSTLIEHFRELIRAGVLVAVPRAKP